MRKAKKILSFVLIFSLIVATFAGLNLYNDVDAGGVYADEASTISLNVVRIGSGADTSNIKKDIEDSISNCSVTVSSYSTADFNNNNTVIKDAELIIIDENLGGTDLSWASAMAIFNKVVGRNGSPAKFMISGKAYGSEVNNYMITNGGTTEFNYYYRLANAGLKFDSSVSQASVHSSGSAKNLYKLFLMLNTYDNPATMYGLFFGDSTTAHGINVDGNLIGWGETVASEGSLGENKQYNTWSTTALKPYHYMNSTATSDELSALGYKETFGLYEVKEIDLFEKVRNGDNQYYTPWGGYNIYASLIKDSADLSRATVVSASRADVIVEKDEWNNPKPEKPEGEKYSISFDGLKKVGDKVGETNGRGDWVVSVNETPKSSGYYSMNKAGVYFYGNVDALFKSGVFVESFTKLVKAADKHEAIGADGDVRILVVQPNGDLAGSGMKVNESVALKMYEKYYTSNNGKTPIDGISAEMMSMYEFNSTSKVLNDSFDIIYLGAEADGNYSAAQTAYGFSGVYATSGTKNSKTTQGNDMSSLKEEQLRNFNGFVAVSKALSDASISGTVVATYLGRNKATVDTNNDFSSVIDAAYNNVKNNPNLVVLATPPIYNAENFFDPMGENAVDDYFYLGEQITDDDYINGKTTSRKMNFTVKASGSASSYTLKLYLDLSADGLYDEDKELFKTETINANTTKSYSFDVLPEGYVGSVPWKLVMLDGSTVVDSVSGMSACKRNSDDSKQVINILQIVTDNDYDQYSATDNKYLTTSFVIPTSKEISDATTAHGGTKISTYNSNTVDGLTNIKNYFSGYLRVPTKVYNAGDKCTTDNDGCIGTTRQAYSTNGTEVRNSLVYNASFFYYYMEKLPDYEIKATRYSLYELEHIWKNDGTVKVDGTNINASVSFDETTGAITYTDSLGETVNCDLLVVGFADALVREGMGTMTGSQNGTMDENVNSTTAKMINNYIKNDRYTLVGHGTLSSRKTETLTALLRPTLGMTNEYTLSGEERHGGNGGNAQEVRVNEGSITRFPYNVPISLNSTNAWKPVYNLNVNDSKIVGYFTGVNATRGGSEDNAYGNTEGNYYLYRRGNMTYANMGFSEGGTTGQKTTTFKLPEAVLLVNTIVSSSEPKSKQKNTPNLVPENPGVSKSSTTVTTVPEGGTTPVTSTKNSYHFYVDYEVTEPTAGTSSLASNAMGGDKYIIVDENGKTYERVVFKVENGPCTVEFLAGTTPVDLTVKKYSDDSTVTTLNNGTEYYIDVPINNSYYTSKGITSGYGLENGNNEFTISAISTSTIDSTKKGYDDFVIARRGLFLIN